MTNAPRITDDLILAMLHERVSAPVPSDLTASVLESVREAKMAGRPNPGLSRGPVLLMAATLAVGLASAVATLVGSPYHQPAPATQQPGIVTASGAPRPTFRPPPTYAPPPGCPEFADAAARGGVDTGPAPVAGDAPVKPTNGDVLLLAGGGTVSPSVFDPFAPSPSPAAVAEWGLSSLAVNAWAPTRDGRVVAAEIGDGECAREIFVMRTDGSSLRRPFSMPGRNAYAPAWSPDGSRLAVATGPGFNAPPELAASRSGVMVWEPGSGQVTDLGRPCPDCVPFASDYLHPTPVWSPDGQRVAVVYEAVSCRLVTDIPCRGIAIASLDGRWGILRVPESGVDTQYRVVRWPDERSLLVDQLGEGLFRVDISTSSLSRIGSFPMGLGTIPPDRAMSPDGTMVFRVGAGPDIDVVRFADSSGTTLGPFPAEILDAAWSPDSRYVMVQALSASSNDRGLYVAPVDGSEAPRLVLEGGYGGMVWLQEVPSGS